MAKIAVLGYGTIGSGVAEVLRVNHDIIAQKAGEAIEIKYILDLRDFPGDPMEDKVVHDYSVIVDDPEVSVVVEAMGGVEPAYTFARQALLAGKHFATSNKALIAKCGAELFALAEEKGLNVMFEASVGGGIPIIRPLYSCLTADDVLEISGILNGTTNYMMTKMAEDGADFDDVLKDAQNKGYAEADPTADIEGHDACRKIAILTSLVCGKQVDFEEIHTEGITKISATDILYAKKMGRAIKLLAMSRKAEHGYCALVAPFMLKPTHPLFSVNDVFNAVFVNGNVLGEAMFYGAGAGKLPTASAVVADVVDIVRHKGVGNQMGWSREKAVLADEKELTFAHFVRTTADADAIEKAFGKVEFISAGIEGETAFVTPELDGASFAEAIASIGNVIQCIRMD